MAVTLPGLAPDEFFDLAVSWAEAHGNLYYTVAADQEQAISRRMDQLSELTKLFYTPNSDFTLTVGEPEYSIIDYDGNPFEHRFFEISNIVVNKNPLRNLSTPAGIGPVSMLELDEAHDQWRTQPDGPVQHWYKISPTSIGLWPAPDQAYADCFAAGYYYHPLIDWGLTTQSGTGTLLLPAAYHAAAAKYCALGLWESNAGTVDDMLLLRELDTQSAAQLSALIKRAKQMHSTPPTRGSRVSGKRRLGWR